MIYGALKSGGGCVNIISNWTYLREQQTRTELHERSEQNKERDEDASVN
jgi:hypothetical protein